jgi:hypothetical protein
LRERRLGSGRGGFGGWLEDGEGEVAIDEDDLVDIEDGFNDAFGFGHAEDELGFDEVSEIGGRFDVGVGESGDVFDGVDDDAHDAFGTGGELDDADAGAVVIFEGG